MLSARLCLSALALTGTALLVAAPTSAVTDATQTHRFEVAMDGTSLSFEGPVNENGVPAKGTPFIIQGHLYPAGTFAAYGDLSGVNPDGSPEFPELVLGSWICRGWHLQDGDATTGPIVATSQVFDFDTDFPGAQMLTTDGIELADPGVPFERAVTGGTGVLADAELRHRQVMVNGANASGGFNAKFAFDVMP